jgi:hypothetical protein
VAGHVLDWEVASAQRDQLSKKKFLWPRQLRIGRGNKPDSRPPENQSKEKKRIFSRVAELGRSQLFPPELKSFA